MNDRRQTQNGAKLFNAQFLFLNGLFVLVYSNISFFFLYPLFLESLGGSKTLIGWVMGTLPASTVVIRPLMPALIKKFGLVPTMRLGLIVIFLASTGYHLIHEISWQLFAVRVIHGFGFSAFVASSFTAAASIIPTHRRAEGFGYLGALILACVAAAPILGEQLVSGFGYPAIFHSAAATAFFSMILASFLAKKDSAASDSAVAGIGNVIRNPSLWLVLLCTILFVNTNATMLTYVALSGTQRGFSGPAFYGAAAIIAVLVRLFGSKLLDIHGKKLFAQYSFFSLGSGMILFALDGGTAAYIFSALLFGTGLGYLYPAMNALAVDQAGPGEGAAVMSLFTLIFDAGFMLGAVLSGFLADLMSLNSMFMVTGISALLGTAIVRLPALKEGAKIS